MAESERIRESLQAPLDAAYLKQREQAGWKLVAVEWERAALAAARIRCETRAYMPTAVDLCPSVLRQEFPILVPI